MIAMRKFKKKFIYINSWRTKTKNNSHKNHHSIPNRSPYLSWNFLGTNENQWNCNQLCCNCSRSEIGWVWGCNWRPITFNLVISTASNKNLHHSSTTTYYWIMKPNKWKKKRTEWKKKLNTKRIHCIDPQLKVLSSQEYVEANSCNLYEYKLIDELISK